jgi:hypothetical protein
MNEATHFRKTNLSASSGSARSRAGFQATLLNCVASSLYSGL